ncbi:hypothetical protein F2Q69_00022173 [Brassica cretica]|uniref:Uncharacterized protein n=1 Tax=Brassica cretica TaxID=69181 RepID=A0A8S9QAZ0_BRACR|nr:hypothetical protein F2Q69_00022173 [Brassica cretica]
METQCPYLNMALQIPRITLLFQCNPLLLLLSDLIEDPMYVLLSFLGFHEEHPQPMSKVNLLKWLFQGYPENSFGETINLFLIDPSLEMLRNLFLSSRQGSPIRSLINMHSVLHLSLVDALGRVWVDELLRTPRESGFLWSYMMQLPMSKDVEKLISIDVRPSPLVDVPSLAPSTETRGPPPRPDPSRAGRTAAAARAWGAFFSLQAV